MVLDLTFQDEQPSFDGDILYEEEFPSTLKQKDDVLDEMINILKSRNLIAGEPECAHAKICLDEALLNALIHGNNRNPDKRISVLLYLDRDRGMWGVFIEDEGEGFDPSTLDEPREKSSLAKSGGQGLPIIRNFMDRIQYYDGGRGLFLCRDISS